MKNLVSLWHRLLASRNDNDNRLLLLHSSTTGDRGGRGVTKRRPHWIYLRRSRSLTGRRGSSSTSPTTTTTCRAQLEPPGDEGAIAEVLPITTTAPGDRHRRSLSCDRLSISDTHSSCSQRTSSPTDYLESYHCTTFGATSCEQLACYERSPVIPTEFETINEESGEEQEEEGGKEEEEATDCCLLVDEHQPTEVQAMNKIKKIEPYKRPEQLQAYWQQPGNEAIGGGGGSRSTNNKYANGDYHPSKQAEGMSKLSVPNMSLASNREYTTNNNNNNNNNIVLRHIDQNDNNNSRPLSSEFSRHNNQLRSSCPPPTRRRRRKSANSNHDSATTNGNNSANNAEPALESRERAATALIGGGIERTISNPVEYRHAPVHRTGSSLSTHSIVDSGSQWVNSKLSTVRKSWLFSMFNSANSKSNKTKSSKWTKSDDFEAEFFERQQELTDSLVSRRSPIDLNPPPKSPKSPAASVVRARPQMSLVAPVSVVGDHRLQLPPPPQQQHRLQSQNNNSLLHVPKPSSPSELLFPVSNAAAVSAVRPKRPRPRSACLDNTYLLRIRDGNYIEFFGNDSKEETCSIVSSTNLLTTDNIPPSNVSTTTGSYNYTGDRYSTTNSATNLNSQQHLLAPTGQFPSRLATPTTNSSSLSSGSFSSSLGRRAGSINAASASATIEQDINSLDRMLNYTDAIRIYWPVKKISEISFEPHETAFEVINKFLTSQIYTPANQNVTSAGGLHHPPNVHRVAGSSKYVYTFALRLICRDLNPNEHYWLHPKQNLREYVEHNLSLLEKGWKFELRIRYVPASLENMYQEDFLAFKFLYEQVLQDYLWLDISVKSLCSNQDWIIELACLEIRRINPHLTPQALEKKSNFETIEAEMDKYFPIKLKSLVKFKTLRKQILSQYKKTYQFHPEDVMLYFMKQVAQEIKYRREFFRCCLGESAWCVAVDFLIGSDVGIAYLTSKASPLTTITKTFETIESINIDSHATLNRAKDTTAEPNEMNVSKKILLNIRIRGETDPLVISCPSFSVARSMADLVDGYHRLAHNTLKTVWQNCLILNKSSHTNTSKMSDKDSGKNSLKSNVSVVIEPRKANFELIEPKQASSSTDGDSRKMSPNGATSRLESIDDGDYSNPMDFCCTEIVREHLRIDQLIGKGQFGDVHKGFYYPVSSSDSSLKNSRDKDSSPDTGIAVAIKISKMSTDNTHPNDITADDRKLLCEAERMQRLDHQSIIKLVGVCSTISPIYVVMELAKYGELRDFLQKHGSSLEQRVLIEYCYQIASALAYLESRQFVHRDIAARNVLVFSFDCIKLADFGLSRYIEDASYYMATNSKLPIKWMAPESINFRRFTNASDVWMFAVFMWEVFMLGKKPFQGVKNSEVIGLIERDERLTKPNRCPDSLYDLMLKCWRYDPDRRPTFRYVRHTIQGVYQNELGLVGAIAHLDLKDIDCPSSLQSSISSIGDAFRKNSSLKDHQKNGGLSSSVNTSQSSVVDQTKIKAILDEQRKQMEADSRWLAEAEKNWQKKATIDSLSNHSAASIYEDANSNGGGNASAGSGGGKTDDLHTFKTDDHSYSVPNIGLRSKNSEDESQYNSLKSNSSLAMLKSTSSTTTVSSIASNESGGTDCGLQQSLRKFFHQNRLTNANVRQAMMKRVSCASAKVSREDDDVYTNTIGVVNSVRSLLKGIEQFKRAEYIDLVKGVGQELRNLVASVDVMLVTLPAETHYDVSLAQKKLSADMNELVESMKKTITHSETPMEGAYKQNMLEAAYVLVIDSKNLLDTLDEIKMQPKTKDTDTAHLMMQKPEQIYANDSVLNT